VQDFFYQRIHLISIQMEIRQRIRDAPITIAFNSHHGQ